MKKDLPTGVTRMPSGRLLVSVCLHRRRRARQCETLEQVPLVRDALLCELGKEGEKFPAQVPPKQKEGWTLETALGKTELEYWQSGKGGTHNALTNAREALAFFGPRCRVTQITPDRIDEYVDHLKDIGNSGSTINRKLSALSRMLNVAYERRKIDYLPKMPRQPEGEHRITFLTPEEEHTALGIIRQLGDLYVEQGKAFLVLLYTGCRCGELWRLQKRDVNLDLNTVTFWKTKNKHPRTVLLVKTIRPIIIRQIEGKGEADRLFPRGSAGWFRLLWDKLRFHMGRVDDPQFVPHMLRHTCATRLAQSGENAIIIKEWLGHTSLQTTTRYTHLMPKDLLNAAEYLNKIACTS